MEHSELKRTREMLVMCGGANFTEEGSLYIQYGVLVTSRQLFKLELEAIVNLKEQVRRCVKQDWENVWANDVNSIDQEFIYNAVSQFKELESEIEEAIQVFESKFTK